MAGFPHAMTDVRERTEPWAPAPPPRRRRWPFWAAIVAAVVVLVLVAGALIRFPYVLISPGDATAVDDVVTIDGARTYRHRGELLFLTVSVSTSRPNLFRMIAGWLDDDVEIVPEEDVFGGRRARGGRQAQSTRDGELAGDRQGGRARASRLHGHGDRHGRRRRVGVPRQPCRR